MKPKVDPVPGASWCLALCWGPDLTYVFSMLTKSKLSSPTRLNSGISVTNHLVFLLSLLVLT